MHIARVALDESLRGLASSALDALDVGDAIARVVGASRTLFEVDGAGLMLVDDAAALRYVVSTDDKAHALERVQEETATGPCVDSLVLQEVVVSRNASADERWPLIQDGLAEAGIRAVLGLPISVASTTVGSLNVYRTVEYEWDESDEEALREYASLIEHVMTSGLLARRSGEVVDQLERALERRVTIDRAVGVVMGTERLGPVEAFARIRAVARNRRIRADVVAEQVLEHGRLDA